MRLSRGYLDNINFDIPDSNASQGYTNVEQRFVRFGEGVIPGMRDDQQKMKFIADVHFTQPRTGKTLILAHRKKSVDFICAIISRQLGLACEKTHGDMTQLHREQAMFAFKHGTRSSSSLYVKASRERCQLPWSERPDLFRLARHIGAIHPLLGPCWRGWKQGYLNCIPS